MDNITYTGEYLKNKNNPLRMDVYKPSPALVEAVNLAMLLERPLLLMGEPGCGKTRLAEAVAAELHGNKFDKHYFRWDIKSNSKATDGIYKYDALLRLYDANKRVKDVEDNMNKYIHYGEFAKAITEPQNGERPNVLLIDEIDKADIDFPNDLLLEIEKNEFVIPELKNKRINKQSNVIIFITSNRERELPTAFLRRCLYYYIKFPGSAELIEIVNANYGGDDGIKNLVENAVKLFLDIRAYIDDQFKDSEKKPATSELLEWFRVINHYNTLETTREIPANILSQLEIIKNYKEGSLNEKMTLPFPQILLKTLESNQLFAVK